MLKLKNNARSTLVASIDPTDTTIRVRPGHGPRFPALGNDDWFPLAIQDEKGAIEYTRAVAVLGDTIEVRRAAEGSVARSFVSGSQVFLVLTDAAVKEIERNGLPSLSISDSTTVTG